MPTTAIIQIKDEVNCKIQNLDLETRRKLSKRFKYEVPYARHLPAVKLGRWDGKVAYFQLGGTTFVNLLPEILPILVEDGYDLELDDQRTYSTNFEFKKVQEDSFAHVVWPEGHPIASQPIMLRDHQVETINTFLQNPQSIQEVATGAGKTIITAVLSLSIEPYGRSVVIVPNKSLVTQTEEDYINLGLDVGVFYGGRKEFGHKHTICTWQSLNSLFKKSKAGEALIHIDEFLEDVVCVMVDECFAGDTLIETPNGAVKIKDLKPGDKVINLDEKTKRYKEDTIVKVHKNLQNSLSEKMLRLEFDNNQVINVTANHKFLTDHGWVRADALTEEMEIIDINTYR